MSSTPKKLFIVQCNDVCSARRDGVHGNDSDVSTSPGSSLPGTMTVDGESSSSLSFPEVGFLPLHLLNHHDREVVCRVA